MTEKIIDGVDVSGCPFFYRADYFSCSGFRATCSWHPNCPYKQFTRKTEECEKLRKIIKQLKPERPFLNLNKQNEVLKNE